MARAQFRSKKKISGGHYRDIRKKKLRDLSREPALTKISNERKVKEIKSLGGNRKFKLLTVTHVNLMTKDGKAKKVVVKNVVKNPANRHYVRRNIITKGSIVETELGKAVVTSRPGQDGVINAKLLE